jgi:Subtilase family
MPGNPPPFPHLPLLFREAGPARLSGGGEDSDQTKTNKANRGAHSATLGGNATRLAADWEATQHQREQNNLPELAKGVPLLIEVDPGLELDELRKHFQFEIVCEHEDGFVIAATDDLDLKLFLQKIKDFVGDVRGSANIAKIHRLHEDPDRKMRLERILSERLLLEWPTLNENGTYICDAGVVCLGIQEIPAPLNRRQRESDAKWARRQMEWAAERDRAYRQWDEVRIAREDEVEHFVTSYGGRILNIFDEQTVEAALPDSFTVRIEIVGRGLKDFVLNYPYLFEVVEPEDIELPQLAGPVGEAREPAVTLRPPDPRAPAVCVIDSGIQQDHRLLEAAIDTESSHCFLPDRPSDDVADYVPPAGHGTRVAGAVLYGEYVTTQGVFECPCWLQNARVLDDDNRLPRTLFPPALLRSVVERYHNGPRRTRIFNQSINAAAPCRLRHMSAWAAEIDLLSAQNDILFIQSAGNLQSLCEPPLTGVQEHLRAGRPYPAYLTEASCRVSNPAQSLQALTVGSIAYRAFENADWRSLAPENSHPSAFSRSGPGIWDVIKPEVVEYGGDFLVTGTEQPGVSTPLIARECYPELVRSTLHAPGPAVERDEVGTSYAAPKVSRIAARLQDVLPDESSLLYRALIVQSARWPEWAETATPDAKSNIIRSIGYGLPDIERASQNSDHRVTLIASGELGIKAGECHVYQVPIPYVMRSPGYEYDIRVEVTLSYVAQPRRTRRNLRRYLSTWVDWKASRLEEPIETFRRRALKDIDGDRDEGTSFGWTLEAKSGHGEIRGVKRSSGTVQKDWATVKSNTLPEDFGIAVVGHGGWSHDPDSSARYSLAVSFEIVGREISIYEEIRVAIDELQAELQARVEVPETLDQDLVP